MDTTSRELSSKNIEQLTWLRGIAAFFVIVSHTLRGTEVRYSLDDKASNNLLISLLDLGSFGVMLFFVLSGCVLYISNSDKVGLKDIGDFYIKRFFRVWPAFFVSLFTYICFRFIFVPLYGEPIGVWIEKQFLISYSIYNVFSYLTFVFNIIGPGSLFNNAYWSLPVEFQYYIIFPILVVLLKYVGILGPIIMGLVLYLLPRLSFINFDNSDVFTCAFTFCGGVVVGYMYKRIKFRLNTMQGIFFLLALVGIASAISNSYIVLPDFPIISNIWICIGVIAIIAVFIMLITQFDIHNKCELFLKHYGDISYSTYLYHNLFVATAVLLIIQLEIYNSSLRLFITLFFTLFASYGVASISYKYIEKPFIKIGRNIIKRNKLKRK